MTTYSYSALKEFATCPRKYYETRVLKLYPRQETEATIWGTQVHEAAELHVRDDKPFGFEFPGQDMVVAFKALKGDKYCELELAVNESLEPVDFKDPAAFIRGIADLVVVNGNKCKVVDFKTGGDKYPDTNQLDLMALLLFARFPEVDEVKGALAFLKTERLVHTEVQKDDANHLWVKWFGDIKRVEKAHEVGVWNEKSSGLCYGYCPCTKCPHWAPLRKKR